MRTASRGKRALLAAVAVMCFAGGALADSVNHARQYQACMRLTRSNPGDAFESALAWEDRGGGHAARHCAAVALIGLKHFQPAAKRLEALAQEMKTAEPELRAGVLAHAGQAWLLADQLDRAYAVQTAALELTPNAAGLLIDRGATLAEAGKFQEAVGDLDRALALDGNRVDALVFRASAHRMLDALDLAARDADAALRIRPDDPDGLLERGNIRRLRGDRAGARDDWLQVLRGHDDTPAGDAARANLEKLDVKQQ